MVHLIVYNDPTLDITSQLRAVVRNFDGADARLLHFDGDQSLPLTHHAPVLCSHVADLERELRRTSATCVVIHDLPTPYWAYLPHWFEHLPPGLVLVVTCTQVPHFTQHYLNDHPHVYFLALRNSKLPPFFGGSLTSRL